MRVRALTLVHMEPSGKWPSPTTGPTDVAHRVERSVSAGSPRSSSLPILVVGALIVIGLGLRSLAADGDLWLDELFTLHFMAQWVETPADVVLRFVHDNNHPINTLYLLAIGPDPAPLAARGLAIAFGGASVLAGWMLGARNGRTEAAVTALICAWSYLLVHYGSEARGYSGLILATLLFIQVSERWLDAPKRWHGPALASVTLFGLLSHLTMLFTLAFVGAWVAWRLSRREQGLRESLRAFGSFDRGPIIGALLFGLTITPGIVSQGGIGIGAITEFRFDAFSAAYDALFKATLGLPDWLPFGLGLLAASLVLITALRRTTDSRGDLGLIVLVGMPVLVLMLQLSNSEYPRYFLLSGIVLLLVAARILAAAIDAGGLRRGLTISVIALFLLGNSHQVLVLHENGRDRHGAALAYMADAGTPVRLGSFAPRVQLIAEWQATRQGIDVEFVPFPDRWCGAGAPD